MAERTYKIRKFVNGRSKTSDKSFTNYSITIPAEIAGKLPKEMRFVCELTDDGILFRPIEIEEGPELPAWAKGHENGKGRSKPIARV